jgi:hypothetical protein
MPNAYDVLFRTLVDPTPLAILAMTPIYQSLGTRA